MNLCLTYMLASSLAKFVMDDQFQNGTQILKSRFQEMVIIWLAKNYPLSLSLSLSSGGLSKLGPCSALVVIQRIKRKFLFSFFKLQSLTLGEKNKI